MNDKAITELFLARDEAALDEVARRYGRMLMSVALGITGNEQDAEECVNDTYLAVWNSIPPTKPENFQAYICRITHNLACRVLERRTAQKRQADVLPLTDELAEVIPAGDGASECDADGLSRAIDGFLRTLPRTPANTCFSLSYLAYPPLFYIKRTLRVFLPSGRSFRSRAQSPLPPGRASYPDH